MPNWQPNWKDVRWNYGQAAAAANKLRAAATRIDGSKESLMRKAIDTVAEWLGQKRTSFDGSSRENAGHGDERAFSYRQLAAQIERASAEARREQARRERDRQRWYDRREEEERQRERAAAQARQQQPASSAG